MTADRVSLRGLAQALGVDEAAVRKGVRTGRLTARSIGRDEAGRPYVRDVEAARREWRENAGRLRPERPAVAAAAVDVDDESAELTQDEREGLGLALLELVLRRDARRFVTGWNRQGYPVAFDGRGFVDWLMAELENERRRDASRKHGAR